MPKKRFVEAFTPNGEFIVEDRGEEKEEKQPEPVKVPGRKFFTCSFCHEKQYEQTGRDSTCSWCTKCGKCIEVHWENE